MNIEKYIERRDLITRLEFATLSYDCILWDKHHPIKKHFSEEDWKKIILEGLNEIQLKKLVKIGRIQVYLFKSNVSNLIYGFAFVKMAQINKDYISIHGGGWDIKYRFLFLQSYAGLINKALQNGLKVHTSCLITNIHSRRFIKSLGFISYRYDDKYEYMYVTANRLNKSEIFRRYNKQFNNY